MNMQRAPKLQWLKFSAMLLIVGAFISILIYVLVARDELVATNADVPLIKAVETPVKRRPENPGGLDIPNRDRVVFDLLSTPEDQSISAKIENTEPDIVALKLTEATPVPKTSEEAPKPEKMIEKETPSPKAVEAPKAPAADAIAALLTVPEPKTEEKVSAPTAQKKSTGSYGVQLASFALRKDADNAAKSYAKKHASIIGNLAADIQRADLGAKGVRYRVRFVGSESKNAANATCRALKAKGQGCLAINK